MKTRSLKLCCPKRWHLDISQSLQFILVSFPISTTNSVDFLLKIQLSCSLTSFGWWTSWSCSCLWRIHLAFPVLVASLFFFRITSYFLFSFPPCTPCFYSLNLEHGYIIGWYQHYRNPWAVSAVEIWDNSLSPFAESSLMWYESSRQDEALRITYRSSPFEFSGSFDGTIVIILSSLSDYFRFTLKWTDAYLHLS